MNTQTLSTDSDSVQHYLEQRTWSYLFILPTIAHPGTGPFFPSLSILARGSTSSGSRSKACTQGTAKDSSPKQSTWGGAHQRPRLWRGSKRPCAAPPAPIGHHGHHLKPNPTPLQQELQAISLSTDPLVDRVSPIGGNDLIFKGLCNPYPRSTI
jgi:hypothetical protein